MRKKLFLSLISSLLLALPWLGGSGFWLLIALVPLLILQEETAGKRFWPWVALTFLIWIISSAWWVSISTMIAAVAVPLVGLFFCMTPMMIYHRVWRSQGQGALSWVILVTGWMAFESLYLNQDISFPWLNLGNGFASTPWAVQWYEYFGATGGSMWILISNILVFKAWQNRKKAAITLASLWIAVPMITSLIVYFNYNETTDPIKVCVVQPNIDPYTEKFAAMSQDEQRQRLLDLAQKSDPQTDIVLMPETAIDDNLWLNELSSNKAITQFRNFLHNQQPGATIIFGATTYRPVEKHEPMGPTIYNYGSQRFEIFNSALWVDTSIAVNYYHKSKLVCGPETVPYPAVFGFLQIDLGGVAGHLGRQTQRSVYDSVGVAICYESIYGEYCNEYVIRGAQALMIITNDGWWGNTQGHRHHLNYARLRAIETRRSIARSANTGISALINQRGDLIQTLGWDQQGVINGQINRNNKTTIYVAWGDILSRLSIYTLVLSLLYWLGQRFRKK